MPRESITSKKARVAEVCHRMDALYPDPACALHFHDPFSLVIAVLLSAQTTDAMVNKVTPELWRRWPTCYDLAEAPVEEVGEVIHPLGFWRGKAAHVVGCARMVAGEFAGQVPRTMDELQRLPGVGRKTANVVQVNAFGTCEGIAVDTHVFRIATRLGLSRAADPLEVEQDLLKLIPRQMWPAVNHQWVLFGRRFCDARKPVCLEGKVLYQVHETDKTTRSITRDAPEGIPCPLADICPSCGKLVRAKAGGKGGKLVRAKAGGKGGK